MKDLSDHQQRIKKEIIDAYRLLVEERYQYDTLKSQYELPEAFSKERVDRLRKFFLTYIYPEYSVRLRLERAFEALDGHLRHPDQLLRLVIDSGRLIFTYGRHLPKVLRAGLKAMKSFRAASAFENHLVEIALQTKAHPPFNKDQMQAMLAQLSTEEIDEFIAVNLALFDTLYDKKLVARILEIVSYLIDTMKKHPKTYSPSEIKGLEWGREIIKRGDSLFNELTKEEQNILLQWTQKIELDFIRLISGGQHGPL